MSDQGIHPAYIGILANLYQGQQARVLIDVASRPFDICRGTKQGDPISPPIFNAVIEHVLKGVKSKWVANGWGVQLGWLPEDNLTNLRFADDILLTARSLPQLKQMLSDVAVEVAKVGLELHPDKTKILHNGIGYGSGATAAVVTGMNIEILGVAASTTYLGRVLKLMDIHEEELKSIISKALAKLGKCTGAS